MHSLFLTTPTLDPNTTFPFQPLFPNNQHPSRPNPIRLPRFRTSIRGCMTIDFTPRCSNTIDFWWRRSTDDTFPSFTTTLGRRGTVSEFLDDDDFFGGLFDV